MCPDRVMNAACHQGNVAIFGENAGIQCTAIALMFLVLSFHIPCENWDGNHMMMGMQYGTELYSSVIRGQYNGQRVYLMAQDLPNAINFGGESRESNSFFYSHKIGNL